MELDIAGQAVFKNLNVRVERHGEDKALGIDLRLQLRGKADDLAQFGAALRSLLYEGDLLRLPDLDPLRLQSKAEDHVLHIADLSFEGVTFSKFVITPEFEQVVQIEFNASISDADPEALAPLANLLLDEVVNVDIEPLQGDLFKPREAAA